MHRSCLTFDRPISFGLASKIKPHTTQLFGRLFSLDLVTSNLDVVVHGSLVLLKTAVAAEVARTLLALKRADGRWPRGLCRHLLRFFFLTILVCFVAGAIARFSG